VPAGSTIKQGERHCVVYATGMQTFFGRAAALLGSANQVRGGMGVWCGLLRCAMMCCTALCSLLGCVDQVRGLVCLCVAEGDDVSQLPP